MGKSGEEAITSHCNINEEILPIRMVQPRWHGERINGPKYNAIEKPNCLEFEVAIQIS